MIAEKVICSIKDLDTANMELDFISVEWYETEKRILHKVSEKGIDIGIRYNEGNRIHDGDVLWIEGRKVLAVKIPECECIAVRPKNSMEMGKVCYDMGNRHVPVFIENEELLTPFDEPLFNALKKSGFTAMKRKARLIDSMGGHGHGHTHADQK